MARVLVPKPTGVMPYFKAFKLFQEGLPSNPRKQPPLVFFV
jgi:hypothetical protein